jgi:hypothetical protein
LAHTENIQNKEEEDLSGLLLFGLGIWIRLWIGERNKTENGGGKGKGGVYYGRGASYPSYASCRQVRTNS